MSSLDVASNAITLLLPHERELNSFGTQRDVIRRRGRT